jgi:hypothetical protein
MLLIAGYALEHSLLCLLVRLDAFFGSEFVLQTRQPPH